MRTASVRGAGTGVGLGWVSGGVLVVAGLLVLELSAAEDDEVSPSVRVASGVLACSAAATSAWCSRSFWRTE